MTLRKELCLDLTTFNFKQRKWSVFSLTLTFRCSLIRSSISNKGGLENYSFPLFWHPYFYMVSVLCRYFTVAIWTQKPFTPLLTRPQGCQGCLKMLQDLLNMEYEVWCAKIAQKRHKLQKTSKLNKKCQKTPVFLDIFEYSSVWGQS